MSRAWLVLLLPCAMWAQTAVWPGGVATDSQLLTAANICSAQLAAPVTSTGTTTFSVTANSPIASCFAANMELRVDNEYVKLISVGSGTITVSRGFDFSVAATHAKYAPVSNVLAAWSHNALRVEVEAVESWLNSSAGSGFTLTTTGSSGAATFSGGTLNIPVYTGGGSSGTVTNFSVAAVPAWETASVATSTTTPALTLAAATGLTSHKFVGTCGSSTTAALCSIVAGDLPTISLTSGVSGLLPIANGGTATSSPALVAGTNVTITGSWPNQTINSTAGGGFTLTTTGSSGAATYGGGVLNIPIYTGGGGGGGTLSSLETSVSSTTLTIGDLCSGAVPCNVRIGSSVYAFTAASTATLNSGTGTAYVYVTSGGVLTIGYTGISLTCTVGCTATGSVSAFPTDSFPIAIWPATSGAWGSGTDARAPYSRDLVVASTGLTSALASGIQTLAVDPGVVNSAWPGSLTTSSSTTDSVSIAAVTSSSHCTLTPTNVSAALNIATTYISAKSAGSITVTHTASSGLTFDILCTAN
jgi:hypothetical protein